MLCFVFSALVVLLDQLFKRWITVTMVVGEQKDVFPGLLSLSHVENYGAAFSILSGKRWLLAAIMLVAILIIVAILLRYNEGFWGTLGLSAVLGGAVGNLIDRVFTGHVVDMFEFKFIQFAIFNVADVFITLGGITFLVFFIVTSFRSGKNTEETQGQMAYETETESDGQYEDEDYDFGDYDDYEEGYDDDFEDEEEAEAEAPKPYLRPIREYELYNNTPTPISPFAPQPAAPEPPAPVAAEPILREVEQPERVTERKTDAPSLLEELGLLESDLEGAEAYEGGDIDDLLREYGFEDDRTQ